MALEAQSLSDEQLAFEVKRIATDIVEKMPSDLWSVEQDNNPDSTSSGVVAQ